MTRMWRRYAAMLAVVALAAAVAGCAASAAYSKATTAAKAGEWDVAVDQYRRALEADPNNPEYRIALQRAMGSAAQDYAEKGRIAELRGQIDEALKNYRRASEFDPANGQVAAKVSELDKKLRTLAEQSQPRPAIQQLREQARQATTPALFRLNEVLPALNFPNASPREILSQIGKMAGINVQFDSAYADPRPYTVDMEGVTLEQALNSITQANQLFYKVTNQRTILVANDSQPKRAQYDEQVIKVLRLSHADATEVTAMLQQVVRITGGATVVQFAVTANKTQNSIMVRAPLNVAQIIEKVVDIVDTPRAEVVIEVEILEVRKSRVKQYGLDLGNYTIGAIYSPDSDPRGGGGNGALNPPIINLRTPFNRLSAGDFYLAVPAAAIHFLESDSQTKLLAKTQLRGSEGQKLTLNLGEDVPVPSTVFTPIAQGGANVSPLSSFNYRTVGIVLEATPRVTYEDEIMIDMNVENSTRAPDVNVGGTNLPSFSTRKVTGQLRLRDGEPNLLAGLLQENDRRTLTGFPTILHVPVIKQLFSANDQTIDQTDIIMLMTPRIIRSHELTAEDLQSLFIGTTANLGLGGPPPLVAPSPVDPGLTAPVNAPAGVPGAPGLLNPAAPAGQPAPTPLNPLTPPPAGAPRSEVQPPPPPQPLPAAPTANPQPLPPGGTASTANTQPGGATASLTGGTGTQIVTTAGVTDMRVGSTANILAVNAANATRLSSVALTITYNPAALRVRSVQQGSFMSSAGSAVAFSEDHNTAGKIDIIILRTGDTTGAAGGGLLASILFDAIGAGAGNVAITGNATVPGGAPQTLQFAAVPAMTVR
jgi:general secretion pathway protein D